MEEAGEQAGSTDRRGVGDIDLEALYRDVSFMDKQSRTPGRVFTARKMQGLR